VRTFEDAARAEGAVGFYRDPSSDGLVVVVPEGDAATFEIPPLNHIPARMVLTTDTQAEIDATIEATRRAWSRLTHAAGDSLFGFFRPSTGHVVVSTSLPASVLISALGVMAAHVVVEDGRVTQQGRFNDFSPFWGGAYVNVSAYPAGGACSTGFSVKNAAGTRFMMTAGHCWYTGTAVVSGNGDSLGTVGNVHYGGGSYDMEWIAGGSYGASIYSGTSSTDTSYLAVGGATDPVEGRDIYCRSGITTFQKCGQTVESMSAFECFANNSCTLATMMAYVPDASSGWGQPGDSGAPIYLRSGSPAKAYIRGMHIGLNVAASGYCRSDLSTDPCPHDQNIGHHWSTIASVMNVTIVP